MSQRIKWACPGELGSDVIPSMHSKQPMISKIRNLVDNGGNTSCAHGPNHDAEHNQSIKHPAAKRTRAELLLRFIRINPERKMRLAILYTCVPAVCLYFYTWITQQWGPLVIGFTLNLSGVVAASYIYRNGIPEWNDFGPHLLHRANGTEHYSWIVSVKSDFLKHYLEADSMPVEVFTKEAEQ